MKFHQILRPLVPECEFASQDGFQNARRSAQDGSKTVLEGHFGHVKNRTDFQCVFGPILKNFGSQNAFLLVPLGWSDRYGMAVIHDATLISIKCMFLCVAAKQRRSCPPNNQDTPKCSQTAPRHPKKHPTGPGAHTRRHPGTSWALKIAPRGPKIAPRLLPAAQDRPKIPSRGPKIAPRGPKIAPRSPKIDLKHRL